MFKTLGCALVFASALGFCGYVDTCYEMRAEVIKIKSEEVIVIDFAGKKWGFYADNLKVGDEIILKFDENHTQSREDDKIVNYRKA